MSDLRSSLHAWSGAIVLGLFFGLLARPAQSQTDQGKSLQQQQWQTEVVRRGTLRQTVMSQASAVPAHSVHICPRTSGVITKIGFDASQPNKEISWNSNVDVGTVLAYIDDAQCKTALKTAQLKLKRSQGVAQAADALAEIAAADLAKQRKLFAANGVTADVFNSAKAAAEVAHGNAVAADAQVELDAMAVEQAQRDLEHAVIRSPIKGTVIDCQVTVGQEVKHTPAPDQKTPSLFVIAPDLSKMQAIIPVPLSEFHSVKSGQSVRLDCEVMSRVEQIHLQAYAIDNAGQFFDVVAPLDNGKRNILVPNSTVFAEIDITTQKHVLQVSNAAQLFAERQSLHDGGPKITDDHSYVYVTDDGHSIRPIEITLGAKGDEADEVVGGALKEGMRVVVGPAPAGPAVWWAH